MKHISSTLTLSLILGFSGEGYSRGGFAPYQQNPEQRMDSSPKGAYVAELQRQREEADRAAAEQQRQAAAEQQRRAAAAEQQRQAKIEAFKTLLVNPLERAYNGNTIDLQFVLTNIANSQIPSYQNIFGSYISERLKVKWNVDSQNFNYTQTRLTPRMIRDLQSLTDTLHMLVTNQIALSFTPPANILFNALGSNQAYLQKLKVIYPSYQYAPNRGRG